MQEVPYISERTKQRMFEFFLKTSIPRIIEKIESETKKDKEMSERLVKTN